MAVPNLSTPNSTSASTNACPAAADDSSASASASASTSPSTLSLFLRRTAPWPPPIPSTSTCDPVPVSSQHENTTPGTGTAKTTLTSNGKGKPTLRSRSGKSKSTRRPKTTLNSVPSRTEHTTGDQVHDHSADLHHGGGAAKEPYDPFSVHRTPPTKHHLVPSDPSIKTCQAIDRWQEQCTEVVVGGHKGKVNRDWCHVHEIEQAQVKHEFIRCIAALPAVSKQVPLPDASDITRCDDLDDLETWEKIARQHAALSDKALACRDYYAVHFAASGLDLASLMGRMSLEELALRSRAADGVIRLVTRRSHLLILTSEDALWLLEPQSHSPNPPTTLPNGEPAPPVPNCLSGTTPNSTSIPLRPPCAPSLQTEAEEPDPVVALERVKRAELLELLSLTGSHASFIKNSTKSVQRVRVIECLFRRLISRDEELLVKAYRSGHDHVLRFFEDVTCCSLAALTRLHAALKRTSSLSLKEAIMDAFRAIAWEESGAGETEPGEEGLGLQLLGGWSYKIQLSRSMSPVEWSHLYDLCGCPGCALRCCLRFSDWTYIRRLSIVSPSTNPTLSPPFEHWADSINETDAVKIFKAFSVVKCAESGPGASEPEIRRIAGGFVGAKGKGMWLERIERNWIMIKLGFGDTKADARQSLRLIDALQARHPLIIRIFPDGLFGGERYPTPPSNQLWYSRYRSASSKALLRHQPWSIDQNAFGKDNATALITFDTLDSPEKAQGMGSFKYTFEVVVLDGHGRDGPGSGRTANENQNRSFEQFEAELGQLFCEALGVEDVKGAIRYARERGIERGEFVDWGISSTQLAAMEQMGVGTNATNLTMVKKKAKGGGNGGNAALENLRDDALALKLSRNLFR
ncbi:BQ5605_C017g08492 [Microbotryum silenes-dioicae]|uniref:BQ5605_C017g08492 protein n=1 Tax=Microbotryum silenes-dioicae TaxID=796604 RepID=A0A2X0NYF5_9BASI|nr:BQ5605_C017g08492 [Microbotryum silenes-dioicae]